MPRNRLQKKALDLPLSSGLSQAEDPRLLQLGQATTIQNVAKVKQSTLGKTLGFSSLNVTSAMVPSLHPTGITRLAPRNEQLLLVSPGSQSRSNNLLWAYDEQAQQSLTIDRISDAFIPPQIPVMGTGSPVVELDTLSYSGGGTGPNYALHIGLFDDARTFDQTGTLYYSVTDPSTGGYSVTPRQIFTGFGFIPFSSIVLAPKVILCGQFAVLTFAPLASGSIYGTTLNMASPSSGWTTPVEIVSNMNIFALFSYDTCVDANESNIFAIVWQDTSRNLNIASVEGAPGLSTTGTAIIDTPARQITACCVWADTNEGNAYVGYSVLAAGARGSWDLSVITAAAIEWPFLSGITGAPGNLSETFPSPRVMDIGPCGTVGGKANTHVVVWSPVCAFDWDFNTDSQNNEIVQQVRLGWNRNLDSNPATASAVPSCAIWQCHWYVNGSGNVAVHNNNPRFTCGAVLASRLIVTPIGNTEYRCEVVGWLPSSNPNNDATQVQSVAVTSSSGWASASPPTVTFLPALGDPGTGATAGVTVDDSTGELTVQVLSGGQGYLTPPGVFISVGSGFTAAGPDLSGNGINTSPSSLGPFVGPIAFVQADNNTYSAYTPGFGYNPTPGTVPLMFVNIPNSSIGGGNGATAYGTVDPLSGAILAVSVIDPGEAYTTAYVTLVPPLDGTLNAVASLPTYPYANVQGTYYLFEMDTIQDVASYEATGTNVPMRMIGTFATRLAQSPTFLTSYTIPHITLISGQYIVDLPVTESTNISDIQSCGYSFDSELNQQAGELGELTGFSGGCASITDGARVTEFSFPYFPENIQYTITVGGGGAVAPGQYQYISTYARRDSAGNVHRSARSVPVSVNVQAPVWNIFKVQAGSIGGDVRCYYTPNPLYVTSAGATLLIQNNDSVTVAGITGNNPLPTGAAIGGVFAGSDGTGNFFEFSNGVPYDGSWEPQGTPNGATVTGVALNGGLIPSYAVNLYIPTMSFSLGQRGLLVADTNAGLQPPGAITVEVYRTTAGGTEFHNIDDESQDSPQQTSPLQNNSTYYAFTANTSTGAGVQDNISDTDLANNELLYGDGSNGDTPGASLDNLMPPPLQGLVVHKNRWWGFNGTALWYSKALTTGEGPGFNEQFALTVDDGDNPITALAPLDEKLIIFKRDRIFYLSGDGPADNGTQNDIQPPQRIASDVGCTNWRSVVTTPAGTWFQSDAGLYLLTRKYQVTPGGTFVGDILTSYPDITSATLDMVNSTVVWTAQAAPTEFEPALGVIIRYSWVYDAWTTQVINKSGLNVPIVSGCLSSPNVQVTLTDGVSTVYRNALYTDGNAYLDDGNYQSMDWESHWVKSAGIEGWGRWWMVNLTWDDLDASLVTVQIAYNYNEQYTDTYTVSATAQAGVTTPLVQWSFQPSQPHAESIRIRIMDAQDATIAPTTGQGPLLLGVTVEYGTAEVTFRAPVNQRGSA